MEWLPAGRGYGWLREWALSGVIVCQLVVDIAAPVLRSVIDGFGDEAETRTAGSALVLLANA